MPLIEFSVQTTAETSAGSIDACFLALRKAESLFPSRDETRHTEQPRLLLLKCLGVPIGLSLQLHRLGRAFAWMHVLILHV